MGCEDPYEEWYAQRSASSAGSLVQDERERQEIQQRQREDDEEMCTRSLPSERYIELGPLAGVQRLPKRAGELDRGGKKRSRS